MQGEWSLGARPRQRGAVRRGDPRPNARCTARLASALAACCCAFTSPACTSGINLRRLVSSESGAHMAISRWLASIHCTGSLRNETCRAYHGKGACGVGGGLQRCWCFGGRGGLTVGLVDSDDLLGLRSAPAHGPSSHWHVAVRQNRSDSFFAVFLLLQFLNFPVSRYIHEDRTLHEPLPHVRLVRGSRWSAQDIVVETLL